MYPTFYKTIKDVKALVYFLRFLFQSNSSGYFHMMSKSRLYASEIEVMIFFPSDTKIIKQQTNKRKNTKSITYIISSCFQVIYIMLFNNIVIFPCHNQFMY